MFTLEWGNEVAGVRVIPLVSIVGPHRVIVVTGYENALLDVGDASQHLCECIRLGDDLGSVVIGWYFWLGNEGSYGCTSIGAKVRSPIL